jgi:sterol 14-demethylase
MKESKTGNFSFWLGKHHVVGVSGEAARKEFLDNKNLDFVGGAVLVGHGPDFVPPIHEIFHPTFHNGRSYFQRRLLDLLKTEQLIKRLPRVTRDARAAFEALDKNPSGITDSAPTCYHLVVKQTCRIVCADEISDDPKLMESYLGFLSILQSTSSVHTVALPWLPSWAYMKRRYARWGLSSIVTPIVNKRLQKATPRKDDAVQMFIENGDSVEYMISFFISILFISIANAGVLAGAVLNIVAHHPEWQDLIYGEIKKAAEAHSPSKDAPLVEQLDSLPLEAWESSFPTIDLCYKEAIRMWVAFPAIRLNTSPNPIQIPGTDEVIPAGSFVAYNTSDAHFNEDIYADPTKYDPERFREGREEFKKQTYGCE